MKETQELVGIIPWTFVFQICNLFIQMYLIKRFLFKPINAVLEKRRAMADAQLSDARNAKQEAEQMKADYEANMASAKEQAGEILKQAQKDAAARSEAVLAEAQKQAAGIRSKAEADIEQERSRAVNDIRNEIGDIAVSIAGKVVEKEIKEDDHRRLIDEFIQNVGEAS